MGSQTKEYKGQPVTTIPGKGAWSRFAPGAPGRSPPCPHARFLISDFWSPEMGENTFLGHFVMAPHKSIQTGQSAFIVFKHNTVNHFQGHALIVDIKWNGQRIRHAQWLCISVSDLQWLIRRPVPNSLVGTAQVSPSSAHSQTLLRCGLHLSASGFQKHCFPDVQGERVCPYPWRIQGEFHGDVPSSWRSNHLPKEEEGSFQYLQHRDQVFSLQGDLCQAEADPWPLTEGYGEACSWEMGALMDMTTSLHHLQQFQGAPL